VLLELNVVPALDMFELSEMCPCGIYRTVTPDKSDKCVHTDILRLWQSFLGLCACNIDESSLVFDKK